jgi:hypothetical protein
MASLVVDVSAFHGCCLSLGLSKGCTARARVGLVSVGCSAWWWSSEIFLHVQVVGNTSSVLLLESNAVIWAVLVLMILHSILV